jgi:GR25 family glycosyltransferase involved in LPS biosynthesis
MKNKNTIESQLTNYNVILEKNEEFKTSLIDMPVYVINLDRDKYRRAYIKYIMNKMKINYTLVIVKSCTDETSLLLGGKDTTNGIVGCFLSHLWCIKHAIDQHKNDHFLIFEDDVVFHKKFAKYFKQLDYKKYDMIQIGCCDFNLKKNMENKNIENELLIYNPKELALGAYGNIYNIHFAKIIFYEKIHLFKEFDTNFKMYYNKYNIGICYPNLVTAELSTTNLGHNYSLFKENNHFNYYKYFINNCFYNFDSKDYYFIWIIFIKYCHEHYNKNKELLTIASYHQLIDDFSHNKETIYDILTNNNIYYYDMNKIVEFFINDPIEITNDAEVI